MGGDLLVPGTAGTQTPALPWGAYRPALRTAYKESVKRRAKSISLQLMHSVWRCFTPRSADCTGTENGLTENDGNVLVTGADLSSALSAADASSAIAFTRFRSWVCISDLLNGNSQSMTRNMGGKHHPGNTIVGGLNSCTAHTQTFPG